ncbi:Sodium channel protein Nach [Eumeta japonica]|uniref:Sodium channel protein Nach n=1 Tax=Eumeta variegata TaxID=151549 RepID=A0A4C1Z5T8_EUMVA|nr:Sodium channel protein Nach [Eumeta japonica]
MVVPFLTRWWWASALVALLLGAMGVLVSILRRYYDAPTYLTRVRSVQEAFPFPAIVIYPQLLFLDSKMDEFIEKMVIPSTMNATRLRATLPQLAAFVNPDVKFDVRDLVELERLLQHNELTPVLAIRRMLPECHESILRCGWRGSFVNCSSLFTMELTGDGYGCVFNGRSLIREMAEGVDPRSKPYESRWFTNVVGPHSGLSVVVDQTQALSDVDLAYKLVMALVAPELAPTNLVRSLNLFPLRRYMELRDS